jgi:hypothetical protein
MKTHRLLTFFAATVVIGIFAIVSLHAAIAVEAASTTLKKPTTSETSLPERFDDLVRDDLFKGMFNGDHVAFARAMKLCTDTLAKDPKHAEAMVWHGSGTLFESGQEFQKNNVAKGIELWQRGLQEMNDAVALKPESISILIARGATLLPTSKYDPNPAEARQLIETGVADYEKTLQLQQPYFGKLSVHSRGELLFGLADGWFRLGEADKMKAYLQRIAKDLAGSEYATRANDWLQTADTTTLQKKSRAMSCIGCHDK